jgi:hypothetical protein
MTMSTKTIALAGTNTTMAHGRLALTHAIAVSLMLHWCIKAHTFSLPNPMNEAGG